jgi:hypothetical protein
MHCTSRIQGGWIEWDACHDSAEQWIHRLVDYQTSRDTKETLRGTSVLEYGAAYQGLQARKTG